MKYTVIGREINGMFVLFGLGDGVYATVSPDGEVKLSIGWASMTKFVTIDTRGYEAVPSAVLRKAITDLKRGASLESVREMQSEARRMESKVQFDTLYQRKYKAMVSAMPTSDGKIAWPE